MIDQKQICICGSMAFIEEMEALAASLRKRDYLVDTPIRDETNINWDSLSEVDCRDLKRGYIEDHLATIKNADLVLIANYAKNGINGYIGPNALMEAAFAYALQVPVAYLLPVGDQSCRLEATAISNVIVGDDLPSLDILFKNE